MWGNVAAVVADALGMPVQSYRQARMDRTNRNYRPPPIGWQTILRGLAQQRAKELQNLCAVLEGEGQAQGSRGAVCRRIDDAG